MKEVMGALLINCLEVKVNTQPGKISRVLS